MTNREPIHFIQVAIREQPPHRGGSLKSPNGRVKSPWHVLDASASPLSRRALASRFEKVVEAAELSAVPRRPGDESQSGADVRSTVQSPWIWLALLALFLIVVVPAGSIAALGRFDGLYGQDPYAYLDYATGPLRQSLLRVAPPPPFYWPPGYSFLIVLVYFFIRSEALAGQLASLVAGGLVPVFTALLARVIWESSTARGEALHDDRASRANVDLASADVPPPTRPRSIWTLDEPAVVALVAGLCTAFVGQLWQSSVVVMADTTGLVLATIGAWALARYGRGQGGRWLVLAAASLAGAVATRWAYALVAIPCAVFALLALGRRDRRSAIVHLLASALVAGIILGPVVVPALRDLLAASTAPAAFATDLQVYRWNPLNALQRSFVTADGRLEYRLPNGLYYALAPAQPYYFTPLLAWLILPGVWTIARRRGATPVLLVLGWAAIVYAFHAGTAWQNFRFTLAYLPPLAILVAVGATTARRVVARSVKTIGWSFSSTITRWILRGWLVLGLAWMAYGGATLTSSFVARKDADLATAHWVQAQLPENALLLTFGLTLTIRHYTSVEIVDLSEIGPGDLSGILSQRRPTFVLVDVANLESQWVGRAPDENLRALRASPGLVEVGKDREYTLLEVRATPDPGSGQRNQVSPGALHGGVVGAP